MIFISFIIIFLPLSSSTFIPKHIWSSADLASYEVCQKKFAKDLPWNSTTEDGDIQTRARMTRLKGGNNFRPLLWPDGRVPYRLRKPIKSSHYLKRLACGMLFFHSKSCIRFVPKTKSDGKFIEIAFRSTECFTTEIGMSAQPYPQRLNLGDGCWQHGTVVHELMHIIGFFHEQSRDDRDQYIRINWNNIILPSQFYTSTRQGYKAKLIGKYDYASIMHYGRYNKESKKPTMTALRYNVNNNNLKMGNRFKPTKEDIWKINHLYSCPGQPAGSKQPSKLKHDMTRRWAIPPRLRTGNTQTSLTEK